MEALYNDKLSYWTMYIKISRSTVSDL